ncbi:LysM peptidoglycan-binding domain-containing protein [Streptomyces sp. NBC_01224]|uniref:transglycosylase family protein n=1 Tax=Streptomyces sp. NBC_01224 TaxID=2903783 RepID=UPI002E10772C|nr:LysM peptidoglycan-binding domain-containing protein [Streptomyces sp. NBC_01224]
MGSANGRHRRPRQAPAIVVAAGVTGSAIAIPLLGAASAHAADTTTWDRVAECESGGMWSADLGNGFYGGLQFSQETWKAYGGDTYAPRADLASRAQQIAVAEKVLDDKGPQAWPSCAVISGLAVDGTLPGVDPGSAPSSEPTQSAGRADGASAAPSDDATPSDRVSGGKGGSKGSNGAGKSAGKAKASAKPSASASATSPSGIPDSSGSSDSSGGVAGKHRGAPAPEGSRDANGGDRESGRHASRGDADARDAGASAADGTYTVHPGDNLWAIADAQKVPGGWPALYEANKDAVGSDPDLILPGQSLDLDVKAE